MRVKCERIFVLSFLFCGFELIHAQTLHPSYFTEQANAWNPASLAETKNSSVALGSERRYLLKELTTYLLNTAFIHSSGNFGFSGSYAGFAGYNESLLSLAYARKMGRTIDLGLRFNYYKMTLGGIYGSSSAIGVVFGSIWHIHEKVQTRLAVSLPAAPRYEWGIVYQASDQFLLSFIVIKEEDQPLNVNGSIKYSPVNRFDFKAGIFTATSSPWIAASFNWKQMKIEVFTAWHPQLGVSPAMILSFEKKSKQDGTEEEK